MNNSPANYASRRSFVSVLTKFFGISVLLPAPGLGFSKGLWKVSKSITVGEIISRFIKEIPNAPFEKTVDTLKSGTLEQEVTGIVTTMFATLEVIQQAIKQNVNFIIAHEPTFYNHQDDTTWLEQDDVYRYKADLLATHKIAVWRCHDYMHSHKPDGVRIGLINALGWTKYADAADPTVLTVPPIALQELIGHIKTKLGITTLRYSGDLSQVCRRVLILPGAAGGKTQITAISRVKPDIVMCGELSEWETAEYVRDARIKGQKISLVLLGHAASEEPGLEWMVAWLRPVLPGMPIIHIPSHNPLSFI